MFVRTYRDADDGVPDSYQALIPLDSFPDTGIAWPRSTLFKVLDDLTAPDTTLDWTINTTFTSAEAAVSTAQNVITNIRDQYRQRGRHADSDDELMRKLASGKELASELKRGSAERGVNPSIVIAAAAADADTVNAAVAEVMRAYRRQNIGARRWRGSQTTLWRAFTPGTERAAALGEFRNPTTTERFAKFVPLLANTLGNRHRGAAGHEPDQPRPARRGAARPARRTRPGEPGQPGHLRIARARQVPHRQAADPVVAGAGRRCAHLRPRRAARTPTRAGRRRRSGGHRPGRSRHVHRPAAHLRLRRRPPSTPSITCCRCSGMRR